ncbi:MAG: teichoic acid biosynthesis protein [Deltaproteobacteria bacterium]|nr:teichoic acid biosynthesis protein [Deltaproteobacteria bacterium]
MKRLKVLYGVVGEGMGHATRSKVVLTSLARRHDVKIVVSGRAHAFLKTAFPDVVEIDGLHMIYADNAVDRDATLVSNLSVAPALVMENVRAYFEHVRDFEADVVVSDFDSFAYLYGKFHDIPVLSVDNMQIINRCKHEAAILDGFRGDFRIAKTIVKMKLPGCYHYLITTFFYPKIRKTRTSLYPPILRPEILSAVSTRGDHVVVYQTSSSYTGLLPVLESLSNVEFRIYGLGREETDGNLTLRPFSEAGFIADLASARAVIAGGGFSLMGEAVYLHKPTLSVPLRGQFEQVLNARYLQHLGYGLCVEELDKETIVRFLERTGEFADRLSAYVQDGNAKLLENVERLAVEAATVG